MKLVSYFLLAIMLMGFIPSYADASPGVLEKIIVNPNYAYVTIGSTFQFIAQALDDQDVPIEGLTFTWNVIGGGTINTTGLFTAGFTTGTFTGTIQATATQGSITKSGLAGIVVIPFQPYVYIAEHPKCQSPVSTETDNCVDRSWFLGENLKWYAYSQIKTEVIAVKDLWEAAIPYLHYEEVLSQEAARLEIFYVGGNPCGDPNRLGCHFLLAQSSFYYNDPDRKASYWQKAWININKDKVPTSGPLTQFAILHEMGHHYGLYERYSDGQDMLGFQGAACNQFERTVMNLLDTVNGCPLLDAPTNLDKQRVNAFWSGGAPLRNDLPILANGDGYVATYRWQDMAWAELYHLIAFYYLDGSQWVYFTETNYPYSVGVHLYTEPRTMGWILDRRDFTQVPANVGHMACTWAWFQASQSWGNGRCSNAVSLN